MEHVLVGGRYRDFLFLPELRSVLSGRLRCFCFMLQVEGAKCFLLQCEGGAAACGEFESEAAARDAVIEA